MVCCTVVSFYFYYYTEQSSHNIHFTANCASTRRRDKFLLQLLNLGEVVFCNYYSVTLPNGAHYEATGCSLGLSREL